jgi:hypothetical protein
VLNALGYNWAILLLEEINTGIWPSKQRGLKIETINHKSREKLRWRGPAATVNYRPVIRESAPNKISLNCVKII